MQLDPVASIPDFQIVGGQIRNKAAIVQAKEENEFFEHSVSALPFKFQKMVRKEYLQSRKKCISEATVFVRQVSEVADGVKFHLAENDAELIEKAEEYAIKCKRIYENKMKIHSGDLETVFLYLCKFANDVPKVEAPDYEKFGVFGAAQRMLDPIWWRRVLRKKHARGLESLALGINQVSDYKGIYCSDPTLTRRRGQRGRNARILQNVKAVNELGQEYTLYELSELSVSNPTIRRMELMTRIKGFEEYSKLWGDSGEFYTITCPSRMHSAHGKSRGRRNKNYDGTTPRQAQEYLAGQWAKIKAELSRMNIKYYGLRVVEPHHDGTPHWHMLLFVNPNDRFYIRLVMARYALEVDGNEAGAIRHRFKAEAIKEGVNPETGREYSAAGYIAKYISKAIDGFSVDYDFYGHDAKSSAERIEAWASTWGIRQFQFLGGPSVTVWRELRRLRDEEVNNELLERARECANAGDWCGYCRLNWCKQIELMKKPVEDQCELNKYGDEKMESVYGVQAGGFGVVTRRHVWEIESGKAATAKRDSAKPWTCVNNCTRSENDLNELLREFTDRYENDFKPKVQWAIDGGFKPESAINQVKRQFMHEKLGGAITLAPEFIESLSKKWADLNPRELLLEEFGEIWTDEDWKIFEEYKNQHFKDFVREYLWTKYAVIYEIEGDK